ncbi:erythritol transport system ATP-binding protein [Streptosporangium becharense]|uniref:Erythritol transport system ATP-binding protein n=1 Tax=Streptosporangium becharense TaxID=1816182 RepID=A0A7W9IF88_9ACTN|nr:sugar ABC transporter ATP-binding protein [Streptosporangium becharense]MBB2909398.1 erythritol transport system ATP-binding protein [Streptosporangium becharense]MBB5819645.1 erythritol transport system ATP-binding protein [Streptosporangium becharense]
MTAPAAPVLRACGVTKVYGGTHALKGVDFGVAPGRVTAVFGENGAGKSTLMKILAGIEHPTTGHVELDGRPTTLVSSRDAADQGIAIIHQELSLCPNLSIQDNLFLAREVSGGFGAIDRKSQRATTATILRNLEEDMDPDRLVGDLRLGQQQVVEIARALLQEARVLIMDEPTSALTAHEVEVLFRVIRELTASGVAIVYISHHLDEALEIADDVVVLRDGRLVASAGADEVDIGWIVEQMVGRDQDALFPHRTPVLGEELLTVRDLVVADPANPDRLAIDRLSMTIRQGEIIGIYGLMGSGRTELLEALAGRVPTLGGEVLLAGAPLEEPDIRHRIEQGVVLVPEDRQRDGLVQTMSVGENLSLAGLAAFVRRLFVSRDRERQAVERMITDVTVKTDGPGAAIGSLSGGNQQKVVIGKALLTDPRVLLLDDPSRGVDVGAKADIFELMAAQARRGLAVLFTTSDAEEALHIPDRLLVLVRGTVAGEFRRGEINREELMSVSDGAALDAAGGGER